MEKLDYEDFAGMFGQWAEIFKPFIESKEMWDIYQRLKTDAQKEIIVPSSDMTFRAFSKTPPDRLKAIFFLMDPYPRRYKNRVNQATGVAMDCSNSPDGSIQPSLEIFYDGIEKDLSIKVERSPSLDYLLDQGVMMLNTDLTCKLNKTASHERVWEPFQRFFLQELSKRTGLIYVLAGNSSHRMERFIPQPIGNHIFKIEHPMAAGHKHMDWNHKGIFKSINKILKENNHAAIHWDKREWDKYQEPPF